MALLAVVPLLFACDRESEYLRWGGTALEWTVAVFFTAIALGGTSHLLDVVAGNRVVVWLGRNSLLLYMWHYAVFMSLVRHTRPTGRGRCGRPSRSLSRSGSAWSRTGSSNAGSSVDAAPGLAGLDDGVPAYLRSRRRAVAQLRTRADREDAGVR